MKYYLFTVFLLASFTMSSQTIFGKWKTVDDETGAEKSIVEIYKKGDEVFGRIVEILTVNKTAVCDKCEGRDKNAKILGMEIIKSLTKSGDYYRNGTILDPQKGKEYKCRIRLSEDNSDILEVRGYIAFLYQSQYWKRVM